MLSYKSSPNDLNKIAKIRSNEDGNESITEDFINEGNEDIFNNEDMENPVGDGGIGVEDGAEGGGAARFPMPTQNPWSRIGNEMSNHITGEKMDEDEYEAGDGVANGVSESDDTSMRDVITVECHYLR